MSSERIHSNIQSLFDEDRHWQGSLPRVVFWLDPEAEFTDLFAELQWEGVQKHSFSGRNAWQLKRMLHLAAPDQRLLIYQGFAELPPTRDWLLDARLYGQCFTAQRARMLYLELKLENPALLPLLEEHARFFDARERLQKLQALALPLLSGPQASPHALIGCLLAVLLGYRQLDAFRLGRELLSAGLDADSNPVWQKLCKYVAPERIWAYLQQELGLPEAPHSLRELAVRLAVTHVVHQFSTQPPAHWQRLQILPTALPFRFVDSWLHDQRASAAWYALSAEISADLHLESTLAERSPESYLDCEAFTAFDQALLLQVRDSLLQPGADHARLHKWLSRRQPLLPAQAFEHHYAALLAATALLQQADTLPAPAADASFSSLLADYQQSHWQLDQAYRHYWQAVDQVPAGTLFESLNPHIEGAYSQFLEQIGAAWSAALASLPAWPPADAPQQDAFFEDVVWPRSHKGENRLAVIISDALRYEVAEELRQRLQAETPGQVQLSARLSPLPSRTSYGMAALLPRPRNSALALNAEAAPRLDGQSTEGLEQRQKLLAAYARMPAVAEHYQSVMAMNRSEGREWVKGFQLAYIYHDQIDATGDKPANQDKVFEACAQTVEDLLQLIKRLGNMNISQVIVTADHGFLYQRQLREEHGKLELPPGEKLLRKHRSLIGTAPDAQPGLISLPLQAYASEAPLYLTVPRGSLRFKLQGGSTRYMHGGAMPQELCAPVLVYQHVKAAVAQTRPKTGVQVLASHHRITNAHFSVRLLQTEPVGENIRPRQLSVFFENSAGQVITNVQQLQLRSSAPEAPAREQQVLLTLTHPDLPARDTVYLRLRDDEDQLDVLPPQAWQLNLSFRNEFGF